ncbi:MAG TPA: DNA polymerase, partial [Sphaerochaeta sp.]|nr:DNA polymerase [Sphaerochaeta sp.]
MDESAIIHVNIIDYAATLAQARDRSLAKSPFVIAMPHTRTPVVLSPSRLARSEGISRGMSVAHAQRRVPQLTVLHPDPHLIADADRTLSSVINSYSPAVYTEGGGHLYLDMRGTARLFGSPVTSALRLQQQIRHTLGCAAAVAVGPNKLVAKIATRTIRPTGLVEVPA